MLLNALIRFSPSNELLEALQSWKELMSQVVQTPEQQFYLTKIQGYDYMRSYTGRSKKQNQVADALITPFSLSLL